MDGSFPFFATGPVNRGLVIDLFAGGGGASSGIEAAIGRPVDYAINHSPAAVAMHRLNHPGTTHFCEDIWAVNPFEVCAGRKVWFVWLSPDCTQFSRAKGGKPKDRNIRCLANVAFDWIRAGRPDILLLENVQEFEDWGPVDEDGYPIPDRMGEDFRAFLAQLYELGYEVEFRTAVAADFGAPTSRTRLFLIARRKGTPAIVWPEATHGRDRAKPWRTAAEIIHWDRSTLSIFDRQKPLVPNTMRRVAAGIERYVIGAERPFLIPAGPAGDACREFSVVAPTLIQTGYGERKGQRPRALNLHDPLGTVVAGGQKHALVAVLITKHYGGVVGHDLWRELGTVTATDHHALTAAQLVDPLGREAFIPAIRGGGANHRRVAALLDATFPASRFERTADGAIIVRVGGRPYVIADVGTRMLDPDELFLAQGFKPGYKLDFTYMEKGKLWSVSKRKLIELAGNSVCPPMSEALVMANAFA